MKTFDFNINDDSCKSFYFTSDLHFNHNNIIKYCNRPFHDIETMDDTLINNWNNKVSDNSIVFILGDFVLGNKKQWRYFLDRLYGQKVLILGNHDRNDSIPKDMFIDILDMAQVFVADKEIEGGSKFILSHYPLATWAGIQNSVCNLHGHIHSTPDLNGNGFDINIAKNAPWNQYDVGVDRNNFTPLSYDDLKVIFTKRMIYGI